MYVHVYAHYILTIHFFYPRSQVVRDTSVWPVPGGHFAVRAGDARPRHGVPRAVLQLHRVHGGADQGRSVRHARRRGVLPTPLPAVRVRLVHAVVHLVVRDPVAGPAAAAPPSVAAAEDYAALDDAHPRRPVAVPVVQAARVPRARRRRWRFLQRFRHRCRCRGLRCPGARAAPAEGPAQEAQTQRPGRHDRQHG